MSPKSKRAKRTSTESATSLLEPSAPSSPARPPAAASSTSSTAKRRVVPLADDADIVLAACRKLKKELILKAEKSKESSEAVQDDDVEVHEQDTNTDTIVKPDNSKSTSIGLASLRGKSIIEVSEMSTTEVVEAIESVAIQIANQVLQKKGFSLEIPSRSSTNQLYVPELDRIVLGEKRGTRSFLNVKVSTRKANRNTLRSLCRIHFSSIRLLSLSFAGSSKICYYCQGHAASSYCAAQKDSYYKA